MASPIPPRRALLGSRLRELRALRYRSGSEFARAIGWPQPRVSKLERGAQLPSQADLDTWIATTGATSEQAAELQEMLAAARLAYRTWADAWRAPGGIAAAQDEIAALDAQATRIGEYQPAMIPGLVQTPAYARAALLVAGGPIVIGATDEQIRQRIAAQLRRQQLLYTPGKQIQLVMGEAALHTTFGDRAVLRGQLDRLAAVAGLDNVEIGILPFAAPSPVLPLAGFALNDSDVVWIETLTGEQRIDDPDQVAAYVAAFEAARADARTGVDAAEYIRYVEG